MPSWFLTERELKTLPASFGSSGKVTGRLSTMAVPRDRLRKNVNSFTLPSPCAYPACGRQAQAGTERGRGGRVFINNPEEASAVQPVLSWVSQPRQPPW